MVVVVVAVVVVGASVVVGALVVVGSSVVVGASVVVGSSVVVGASVGESVALHEAVSCSQLQPGKNGYRCRLQSILTIKPGIVSSNFRGHIHDITHPHPFQH